MISYARLEKF
jgi:hypothetical protein